MDDLYTQKLLSGHYYHIYNRANSQEQLFYSDRNYEYFLRKLKEYLFEYLELYAFCLLPNHFHLLVKVINEERILSGLVKQHSISKGFGDFFNCYTKSINKQLGRYGNLFQRPFKRKAIKKEDYLIAVVNYIHRNPVHHGYVENFGDYKWSSYESIIKEDDSFVKASEVLHWFGDKDSFIEFNKKVLSDYKEFIFD